MLWNPQVSQYFYHNRYKIDIYVKSADSKYKFVLWDADYAAVIQKSAADVYQSMIEVCVTMHSLKYLQGQRTKNLIAYC